MGNRPRSPWIAVLLTIFAIGLGHVYNGDKRKGIALFIGFISLYLFTKLVAIFFGPIGGAISLIATFAYTIYCIVTAAQGAMAHKFSYSEQQFNRWQYYLRYWFVTTVVILSTVQIATRIYILQMSKIPSGAMRETIQIGDHIFIDKLIYTLREAKRGDVVVFPFPENPSKNFLSRVIGLGGEILEIKDKRLIINGKALSEPYATHIDNYIISKNQQPRDNLGPLKIPQDAVFVMGDNRDQSYDSRFWGPVKKTSLKGKARWIYWSWDKEMYDVRWDRIGKKIEREK